MIKTIFHTLLKGGVIGLLLSSNCALAAAEKVNMDRMLDGSTLVIQGTVIGQRIEQPYGERVQTILTLDIVDTIKGSWDKQTIDLSFLGGSLNGITVKVGGQHLPELGQEGVFFIENPSRNQVNPFYGWEQGLFVVETDANSGQKVVKTATKQTIHNIDFLVSSEPEILSISNGTASGVKLVKASELKTPYTLEQFKSSLRSQLQLNKGK